MAENVFEAVKQSVSTREAAEFYGIKVSRTGMACCPFHDDKNPSMKVDQRFHCFGCGEDGDVIDFTEKLFDLSPKEAAEKLAADGIDAKVINIHTIKPLDEELIVAAAKETGKVVTVEEHSIIGGLGGAVCECLSEKAPVPVKRIGINDVYGESGPAVALLEKYGLDAAGIYKQIKAFI